MIHSLKADKEATPRRPSPYQRGAHEHFEAPGVRVSRIVCGGCFVLYETPHKDLEAL